MGSLIPGYEYDIFISYRQKDNKHDGWVTEFVNNLKGELESTFKEDICVYFDINPHDGLLETHDVDESLKNKLKCLVFIPIISRTYCDPKSFAWVHEFKAFKEQASADQLGLKVKLPGGNVANRILPVQIHDLSADDKKLVESELGGFLRGVEFIYKEPGVNRPLTQNDDEKKNQNGTKYKNQINKVANAISEIIDGLKNADHSEKEASEKVVEVKPSGKKNQRKTIITGSVIALALIILGIIFIPKLLKPAEPLEKSIAVLPFKLLSDEPDKQYLADGMMDAILLHLSKIEDLRVKSRTSVEQYRNPDKGIPEIGRELGVEYLLEGSFQKSGDNVRLIVQLIKADKDDHIWSKDYDRNWNDIFSVQSEVAQAIATELHALITPEEKQIIEKAPTANLLAYDLYQRGKEEIVDYWLNNDNKEALKRAEEYYNDALKYDSAFAPAYSGLAMVYFYKNVMNSDSYFAENYLDSVLILANKASFHDGQLAEAYYAKGCYYLETSNPEQTLKEYGNALKYNPNYWEVYADRGRYIYMSDNADLVKAIEDFNTAISLTDGRELSKLMYLLGSSYFIAGFYDKAMDLFEKTNEQINDTIQELTSLATIASNWSNYEKAVESSSAAYNIDSNNIDILYQLGYSYMFLKKYKESLRYFEKYIKRVEDLGHTSLNSMHRIGYIYWQNGFKKEAEFYFNEQKRNCEEAIKMGRSYATDLSAYYDLGGIYAFLGNREKAYENLRIWSGMRIPGSWWINLFKDDPMFDSMRNEPEFQQILRDMESKYQAEHERVRKWLEEQGML